MLDTQQILETIYRTLDFHSLFEEHDIEERPEYFLLNCPRCQKREAYISKTKPYYIACNRKNKCQYYSSIWAYVQNSKNLTQQETLFELARLAQYELSNQYSEQEVHQYQKRTDILEATMHFFQNALETDEAQHVRKYIEKRGYLQYYKKMELGYFPGYEKTVKYLKQQGYRQECIKILNFLQYRENYQIVFPYRAPSGSIISIWGRSLDENEKRKYLPFTETQKATFFNLHEALRYDRKTLVIVEGYFDSLLSTALERPVVALGGANFTKNHIDTITKYKVQNIIFALDNDDAGKKATELAIKNLLKNKANTYVVSIPKKYKDPDEFIINEGIDPFQQAIKQAISGAKYVIETMSETYDLTTPKSRRDYLNEVICFEGTINNPLDSQDVINHTVKALNISEEALQSTLQDHREKQANEKLEKDYHNLFREGQQLLREGKIKNLAEYLENTIKTIQADFYKTSTKPVLSFAKRLENFFQEEENRSEGLLGYRLNQFENIARNIDGLQAGFYIIAADTNIGKTALLTNLFLDTIYSNPEVSGLYFSLDDSYKVIATRLRGIMTRIPLNKIQNKIYGESNDIKQQTHKQLISLAQEQRLIIKDLSDVQHIDDLEIIVREKSSQPLFVCIDGLYNLQVGKSGGLREENIERANKLKELVDVYGIPIITTAEVRKRTKGDPPGIGDLMESAKFSYNANVVWTLYLKNEEEQENLETYLTLDFQKNKLSAFKGIQTLRFFRDQSRIEEVNK